MSTNYAYIDGQNLHSGVSAQRWKLDHKKFRDYLRDDLGVEKAFIFLGFMEEHQDLYNALQEAGFILFFKPLIRYDDGAIKGNVDADMVLKVMIDIEQYDNAVIVSGDGDFAGLIRHLAGLKKLKKVIIPNKDTYSSLFKRMEEFDTGYFVFIRDLRNKVQYGNFKQRSQGQNDRKPSSNSRPQEKSERPARIPRNAPKASPVKRVTSKPSSSRAKPPKRAPRMSRPRQAEADLISAIENAS